MTDSTRTIRAREDWLLADDALRTVIGGETGDLLRGYIVNCLFDLRMLLADEPDSSDIERHIDECAQADAAFPYSHTRMQALAESLHHFTFESELATETTNPVELAGDILHSIITAALQRIVAELRAEA